MRHILSLCFLVITLSMLALSAAASHHQSAGDNPHSSAAWQIEAYASAAPAFIGNFATIIGGDGSTLREGTNGWTCQSGNPRPYPENGWPDAHTAMPICHDDEGMKWMAAYMQGKKPELTRDSYMWMLHGDVGEDNLVPGVMDKEDSTPGEWIESGPHLMLMPKDPASLKNFSTDFTVGAPYVMFPDTDYVHLMIPMPGYYQYQPESAPKAP